MDVVRLDLGRDRAQDQVLAQEKTIQRCKLKPTGLCKTLHLMSVPIWSLL
jgi:hypothetical protein